MPYAEHPQIKTPSDETVIWRYMDLPKFLLMLEQRGLYFALLSEFEDTWEAVIGRQLTMSIASHYPVISGDMISLFQEFNKQIAVNCWYRGADESVAMWRLYTSTEYGVAIKSNVGSFKRALIASETDVLIGTVEYTDHTEAPSETLSAGEITPFKAVLQKRTCYKHECELRAMAYLSPDFPDNPVPGQIFIGPHPQHGRNLSVDLSVLIQSITTGPRFPSWADNLLATALSRAGLNSPIVESNAFKPPEARFFPG